MTAPHATATRSAWLGLSPGGFLSLAAVLSVLAVVSLPRLSRLARHENQGDARATAERLALALASLAPEDGEFPLEELARRTHLTRTLRDAEWLEGGRILRLHGYLFERCAAPAAPPEAEGKLALSAGTPAPDTGAVRAWPWSPATGRTAFLATEAGLLFAHANEDGTWQGLSARPATDRALSGWRVIP